VSESQRYFEDVDLGDEYTEEITPTPELVKDFLALNPARGGPGDGRFTSDEGARSIGMRAAIVPGVMSMSIISRLVEDWMGAEGTLHSLDVSYRRPVLQGDDLKLQALVTDADETPEGPRVKLDVYMENARGERPLQGTAVVELPRKG
jgi:MaoC dehydratase-like protein